MSSRLDPALFRWVGLILGIVCILLARPADLAAMEIGTVDVQILNSEIRVSATLKPDPKFIRELSDGLSKELIIYVDLFRIWKLWPNEFVRGIRLTRLISSDPIKREHVVTQFEGPRRTEMRFADLGTLTDWAMKVSEQNLGRVDELEKGTYFVKVTVESQIKKLPPVIGYFLFFVPEKEFSASKNSPLFQTRGASR